MKFSDWVLLAILAALVFPGVGGGIVIGLYIFNYITSIFIARWR